MKRILLILLAFATTSLANGQILKSIGLKGGISIANQKWHFKFNGFMSDKDSKNGIYGAVTLDFFNSKYFNFTTDLGYCEKGSSESILVTTNDMPEGNGLYKKYDTKFNYFAFSPMLKAKYEISRIIPYVLIGIRFDYQLSYKSDFNFEQIEKDFNEVILGANFGAGIEYKNKNTGIFVEGHYQYDFTKVINQAVSQSSPGIEISNKAAVICIGLKYYLTNKKM